DFVKALVDFVLDGGQIAFGVRPVGCLNRQFADALQVVVDFVQRTFSSLRSRDTVVRVTRSLSQALDVGSETVGDGLTGSVVLGAVDAQAGGQALDGRAQGILRL